MRSFKTNKHGRFHKQFPSCLSFCQRAKRGGGGEGGGVGGRGGEGEEFLYGV